MDTTCNKEETQKPDVKSLLYCLDPHEGQRDAARNRSVDSRRAKRRSDSIRPQPQIVRCVTQLQKCHTFGGTDTGGSTLLSRFAPENELEQAMLQAASDPSAAPEFYRLLMENDLIVLGTKTERLALDVIKHEKGFFHPVFTSSVRLAAFSTTDVPNFPISGRLLFEATHGAPFIINPRSPLAKILLPEEITWCLENFRSVNLAVLEPASHPTQLIKALCVLFTNRSQLSKARLAYVAAQDAESGARITIGIEADGDVRHLAREIFEAAAEANPSHPVDVVHLNTQGVQHPLQRHMLTVQPFFERQVKLA